MKTARIYCRVSTNKQDLVRQDYLLDDAKNKGFYVVKIYKEKASGTIENRPALEDLINDLQDGDVIIAESTDRLTRLPLEKSEKLFNRIKEKGAKVSVPDIIDLTDVISSTDNSLTKSVLNAMQNVFISFALAGARSNYEKLKQRQQQGIARAKTQGKYKGRPADKMLHDAIIKLRLKGLSINQTAKTLGCSASTVNRVFNIHKKSNSTPKNQLDFFRRSSI